MSSTTPSTPHSQEASVSSAVSEPLRRRRWTSSIFTRLAIIALLGNLPILYLSYKFVTEELKGIEFAETEAQGVAYIRAVWPAFQDALAGSDFLPRSAAVLRAAGERFDPVLGTGYARERFEIVGRSPETRIEAGRTLIGRIAENANLAVDPDLNTLRAIHIVTEDIPEIAHSATVLFADLVGPASETGRHAALDRFARANELLVRSLGATDALNLNTDLTVRLTEAQMALGSAAASFITAANRSAVLPMLDAYELFAAFDAFQMALSEFWLVAIDALDILLQNRIAFLKGNLQREIQIGAGIYFASFLLVTWLAWSLNRRAGSLRRAVYRIRSGDLDEPVPHTSNRDEIGDATRAMEVFRNQLIEKRKADELLKQQNVELQEQQSELSTKNLHFDAAINSMRQGLAIYDSNDRLVTWNRRFAEIYNLGDDLLRVGARHSDVSRQAFAQSQITIDGGGRISPDRIGAPGDYFVELNDGRVLFVQKSRIPDGGLVSTHDDITERRRAESQLAYMAYHDALTLLPNRALLRDKLAQALDQRKSEHLVGLLHIDLDHFRPINDTLGHPIGDALLKVVAERLLAAVGDRGIVSRFSGDEFGVVLGAVRQVGDVTATADRIVSELAKPYEIEEHRIVIGCSIGVAIAPRHGSNADTLFKNADVALNRAKLEGRGCARVFEKQMNAELQRRRLLEMDLRQALASEELELQFQPLVDLEADRVFGFEALLRWHHPSRGMVRPADFIPLAEETGLILPIGEWVLRRACAEAAKWPDDVNVAVNLSPLQFNNANLVGIVVNALSASQIRPPRLELEITESLLLDNSEATLTTLHQLRSLGVRISMDDFGTGYSSLSYLRSFPFDKIKIDQAFVRDLDGTPESATIIRAVVGLGRGLGIRVIAEGVETPRQLQALRNAGCVEAQGMLFSPPRPAEDVPTMLGQSHARRSIAVA